MHCSMEQWFAGTAAGLNPRPPRDQRSDLEAKVAIAIPRMTQHPLNTLRGAFVLALGVAGLALGLVLSGCSSSLNQQAGSNGTLGLPDSSQPQPGAQPRIVKVALLLPLGGFNRTAVIAKSMRQAGEMALFERNEPSVQLIVKDDRGTADGARAAATEAIREGAQIILGPLLSKSVSGAAPVARSANVPVVSFSNNEVIAGRGVYLMSFLPHQEVERITSYALTHGKRRFAALVPDTVYGRTVEKTFRDVVARAGGQIVVLERYPVTANGMLKPAKRVFEIIKESQLAGAPIDALFLPGGQDTLPTLGPLIAYSNIDPAQIQLLGTGGWEFPNIGRDNAFVGGWYPSPDPRGWQAFSGRFAKNFGQAPPRLASLAYDAVNMAISLSRNPSNGRFGPAALSRPNGFQGTDGPFRFMPSGILRRGLAILEVKKFGSRVIDPAETNLNQDASGSTTISAPAQPASAWQFPFGASLLAAP